MTLDEWCKRLQEVGEIVDRRWAKIAVEQLERRQERIRGNAVFCRNVSRTGNPESRFKEIISLSSLQDLATKLLNN